MSIQKLTILLILLIFTPMLTNASSTSQSSITVKTKLLFPDNQDHPSFSQNKPELRLTSTTLDTKNQRIIMVGRNVDGISEIWEFSTQDITWNFVDYLSNELNLYIDDIFYDSLNNQVIIIAIDLYTVQKTYKLTEENEISRVDIFPSSSLQRIWTEFLFIEKQNLLFTFGGRDRFINLHNSTRLFDFVKSEWILIDTPLSPSGRVLHSMIYDPTTEQIVLFGGIDGIDDDNLYIGIGDTWVFDLITLSWTEIIEEFGPESRARSQMLYDSSSNLVVLFGGSTGNNSLYYDDLWSFDTETYHWNLINNSLGVGARGFPSIDYIASSKSIILSGGFNYDQTYHFYNDTWEISILYPPKDSIFDFNKMIIPLGLFMIGAGIIVILAIMIRRKDS